MSAYMTKEAVIVLIDTDEPLCFTTIFGPLDVPADDYQPGGTYLGIGNILDLPPTEVLMDGTAQTATLTLAGLDQDLVNLIDAGAAEVENKDVSFGKVVFNDDEQLVSVEWMQTYVIQKVNLPIKQVEDEDSPITHVQTCIITLGYGDGKRRRPVNLYWTNDQAAAGDLGFSAVPGLTGSVTRPFPPKG